nr:MAG TPA: chitin synthase regulator [Caudoviricetes sp.]
MNGLSQRTKSFKMCDMWILYAIIFFGAIFSVLLKK